MRLLSSHLDLWIDGDDGASTAPDATRGKEMLQANLCACSPLAMAALALLSLTPLPLHASKVAPRFPWSRVCNLCLGSVSVVPSLNVCQVLSVLSL
eukprot:4671039-Pleurochrysis_carterae.AAC.1